MYFVDLKNLDIKKEFHFETFTYNVPDITELSVAKTRTILDDAIIELISLAKESHKDTPVNFEIIIDGQGPALPEDAENFLSVINVGSVELLRLLCTENGRPREYHLDVPEKLKVAKVSLSSLKKAINFDTYLNQFNLTIKYKDLVYVMFDEKRTEEVREFIHEISELENDA